mmetsp:Transcript_87100/g.177481  ORF Transcript_87100/g.177481 Transcript_87100/m.177481 type:complete len:384 (+) Transcript_87100:70-1221(+)|eukprot:CAMPEP_0201260330 /NCGR_PEP_ID=MMETSP0853-20130426/4621_1 /ASSEMBLY_ACC=CAM_ASM_000640 /TAXON_ID=183588 /ORGANISM="Pseudo-nitzschia fraudulenta, Strain WWA7" /LENGTH=383 /DNA_ID=CAMNT_0047562885 /DNA_START=65 /DNA_END=1216 /DNA_ORIENTATION=+
MASSGNSGGGGEQWAWLGLLKWTLAHQDGTRPSSESPTMMSDEDKAFLEKVMAEGIVDESDRMRFILQEFSSAMDYYKHQSSSSEEEEEEKQQLPPPDEDDLEDLLQELRDIVEQVDFARGFVGMKGCDYLLGAISATSSSMPVVPTPIRNMCVGILATLAQNNPPVQKVLLEAGAIKTLSDLFLLENSKTPLSTKTKIMQALSAIVRCYDLTEAVFEKLPQAPALMVVGLSSDPEASGPSLRAKTLFFLRAFLTSDKSSPARAEKFCHAIAMVADTDSLYLNNDVVSDGSVDFAAVQIRESAISLLQQLLERRLAVALLLDRKKHLASLGIQRIQHLRAAKGEEAELTRVELRHWESLLLVLARTNPEEEEPSGEQKVLLLK